MSIAAFLPNHRDLWNSLGAWVAQLVDEYPGYDEYDLTGLIEERTGLPVRQPDFQAIRAFYLRAKLQEYRVETEEEDEPA